MLNRILGRKKKTIWCDGYDSPVVLTPVRALLAIAYLYANPAKDNLEVSIDRYPGFSTWQMYQTGIHSTVWKRLRRPQFSTLAKNRHNLRGYTEEARRLEEASTESLEFTIEPNAWLEAFGVSGPEQQSEINQTLLRRIRVLEERAAKARSRNGGSVIGRERLISRPIDPLYRPRRYGRRMWCLSERRSVRSAFIRFFRNLMAAAREVRAKWARGETWLRYPPGLFPPSMPKLANLVSA